MPSSRILQYRKYPRYSSKVRLYDRSSDNSNNPVNVIQVKDTSNVIIDTNHAGSVKKDFSVDQLISGSESFLNVSSTNINLKDISNVVFNTGLTGSNIDISASSLIEYHAPSFNLGYNSVSDIIQYTSGTANLKIDGSNNNLVLDSSNIELNSTKQDIDSTNVNLTSNNTFDIVATNVDINPINNFNIDVNDLSLNATNNVVLDSTNIVVNATDISLNSNTNIELLGNNNVTLKSGSSSYVDLSNGETNVLAGDIIVNPSTKLDISSNIVDIDAENVNIDVTNININSDQSVKLNNSGSSAFEMTTINSGELDISSNKIVMNSNYDIYLNNDISINGISGDISMLQNTIGFSGETIDISCASNDIIFSENNSTDGLDISYIVTDASLNASNNVSINGTDKVHVLSDVKVYLSGNNNVTLKSGTSSSVDLSNGETNVLASDIIVNPSTELDILANNVDINATNISFDATDIDILGVNLEVEGLTKIDASGDDVNIVSSSSTNINNQDKNEIQVTPTLIEVKNTETSGVDLLSSNIEFKSDNVMNINTQTFTQTQTHKYENDATEDVSNVSILGNVVQTDNTTINSTDISFVSNGNKIMNNGTIDDAINVNVSNNINLETTELNVTGNKFTIEGSDLDITTGTFNVNSSSGITFDPSDSDIILFDTANTDNSFQLLHSDVRYNFTDVAKYMYDMSYDFNEYYNENLGILRIRFNNLEASFNSTISGEGVDTRTLKTIVDVYNNLDISQEEQIYQMQSTFVDVLYRFNELVGVDNDDYIDVSYTISAEDIDSSFVNVVEPTTYNKLYLKLEGQQEPMVHINGSASYTFSKVQPVDDPAYGITYGNKTLSISTDGANFVDNTIYIGVTGTTFRAFTPYNQSSNIDNITNNISQLSNTLEGKYRYTNTDFNYTIDTEIKYVNGLIDITNISPNSNLTINDQPIELIYLGPLDS